MQGPTELTPRLSVSQCGQPDSFGFDLEFSEFLQVVAGHLIASFICSGVNHLAFNFRADRGFNADGQFTEPREKKTGDIAGKSNLR